jgi:3-deoxy-D-manno-octulosonic-acid transferase
METEIWFNFLREAKKHNVMLAIVNGRLSQRSYKRYGYIKQFIRRVLTYPDLALVQTNADAKRIMALGMRANKVKVTGNIKFDQAADEHTEKTEYLRDRFSITNDAPLIIAASTHAPEEKWILEAFKSVWKDSSQALPRLMIAPRHPERFQSVADEIKHSGFSWARRSELKSSRDSAAEVILLDSIGELRAAYDLAEIVFVGGSLIPHGGQSILEPAAAGKAIITGPHTSNFAAAVDEFLAGEALIQLPKLSASEIPVKLAEEFAQLLSDPERRQQLGRAAGDVMIRNRGATERTIEHLRPLLTGESHQ